MNDHLPALKQALAGSSPAGSQLAKETFQEARDTYHPIAAKMTATDLKL